MIKAGQKNMAATLCRVVLGLTFIFSGLVKTVDPWGTALKVTEYLNVYGAGEIVGLGMGAAIVFCAAELTLGLMLVFGVMKRLVSIAALIVMSFFLVVTFLSATVMPVEDCGCFGDALRMSPWASFAKNVVLWGLAFVVWRDTRRRFTFWPAAMREVVVMALFACTSVGLGLYCYLHLPLIDFLPYKKGVNLREAVYGGGAEEEEAGMVYRDLRDGSLREFAVSDTTWYDAARWEFVEMVERQGGFEPEMSLRNFAVFNSSGDATREILESPGSTYLLCAAKLDEIGPHCAERFEKVTRRAYEEGARVVLLTASPISDGQTATFGEAEPVAVYNLDATTMITMLRATTGMVVLEDGVIADKRNCRDIN